MNDKNIGILKTVTDNEKELSLLPNLCDWCQNERSSAAMGYCGCSIYSHPNGEPKQVRKRAAAEGCIGWKPNVNLLIKNTPDKAK